MAAEKSPDEILELAQQRVAERKADNAQTRASVLNNRFERERPWRAAFAGAMAVLLFALLFAPGLSVQEKMFAVAHGICAQEHTITLGGMLFPICARNTGIYASVSITVIYLMLTGRGRAGALPPLWIGILLVSFVAIMAVDGFNSVFVDVGLQPLYEPQNWLRTLTGLGMGITVGCVLVLILNNALREDVQSNMGVIGGWRDFAAILLIDFLALAVLYGNIAFLYWPLAFLAWGGILGVMFAVNLLLVGVIMGYEGNVTRLPQLARPATIALGTTLLLVLGLAGLRLWMEAQGLITN